MELIPGGSLAHTAIRIRYAGGLRRRCLFALTPLAGGIDRQRYRRRISGPTTAHVRRLSSHFRAAGLSRLTPAHSSCTAGCDNYPQVAIISIRRAAGLLALAVNPLTGQTQTAAELGRAIRSSGLDPMECYRIHDVELDEEDARFYLTSGYLIFSKPVNGSPVSAVFSADVEGGDAEVLLLPPDRSERLSLAKHIGTPNLNEHFTGAIFLFTDTRVRDLLDRVKSSGDSRRSPDIGALLADRWNATVGNVMGSFESRMVLDLMNGHGEKGFFESLIQGKKLGNFDVIYDPRAYEQVAAGQVLIKDGKTYWETWTSFATKSDRGPALPAPEERIISYRIEAELDSSLMLHCTTRIRIQARPDSRNVIPFDFSGQMQATAAKVDGVPAEVYERDSVRNGMVQNSGNELLLVIPAQPLEPGSEHEIEIEHEGKVVLDAGNQVYFVNARGSWYPNRGLQFATYDVTYRYPKLLNLVGAGEAKEDRTEGDTRITRRVPDGPLRTLGFNLGQYESKVAGQGAIQVEVFANREIEAALGQRAGSDALDSEIVDPVITRRRSGTQPLITMPSAQSQSHPADALSHIASEVAAAMEFYKSRFGPPPLNRIEVSPVPGRFGQGFAGMIYLSTLSYLPVTARPLASMGTYEQVFFGELLRAHEAAHQWWGNVVSAGSYHHEWLMEALANYSALMFLESRKGPKFLDGVLDEYRREMLLKNSAGETVESGGPLVQGARLETLSNPNAWSTIIYGKGTWVIHMLRRRMGDAQFMKMLAELRKRYEWKTVNTEEFRLLCAEFLPPQSPDPKLEDFFDQWVYGTGIPTLKIKYSVTGKVGNYQLKGTITQTDVPDDFSVLVPVEIQTGRGKPVLKQIRSGSDPVAFSLGVAALNAKAALDPGSSVLRR